MQVNSKPQNIADGSINKKILLNIHRMGICKENLQSYVVIVLKHRIIIIMAAHDSVNNY